MARGNERIRPRRSRDPDVIRAREESRRIVQEAGLVLTDLMAHIAALHVFIQQELASDD